MAAVFMYMVFSKKTSCALRIFPSSFFERNMRLLLKPFTNAMRHSLALFTLVRVSSVLAAPGESPPSSSTDTFYVNPAEHMEKRQVVNCTDPRALFDGSCWATLNLTYYLNKWNHTTPTCPTSVNITKDDEGSVEGIHDYSEYDGSSCCKLNEPWTTCFLRVAAGRPASDCSVINTQSCHYDLTATDSTLAPEVRYILKTIYGIYIILNCLRLTETYLVMNL